MVGAIGKVIAANEQNRSFAWILARKLPIVKIHVRQNSDPKYLHSVKRYAGVPTTRVCLQPETLP